MNTAADFLYRLQMDPNEKKIGNIWEDNPTKPIEVNVEPTSIAQEKPLLFDNTEQCDTTEKELRTHQKETPKVKPIEPPVIKVSCYYANDLHKTQQMCT